MQETEHKLKQSELPSNIKIMFGGITDNKFLDFLFSSGLDKSLDGLFNAFMKGDYSNINVDIDDISGKLSKFLSNNGNDKPFQGEISKQFFNNISRTIQSEKFNKTKSYLRKCIALLKNLKKEARTIDDPEKRQKFKDAIYSFKKILKLLKSIYKNRDIVSKRALKGINAIVYENYEYQKNLENSITYIEF